MAFIECQLRSYVLDLNVNVNVIIPQDIETDEKIKVLYLLHGYIGNHTDWMRYSSIERYVQDKRIAVVMPSVHNSYYTDMANGFKYFTYLTQELPKIISKMFPISTKREDNFVCGLSMGGYGALKMALAYPNQYAKAASLSGALDIDMLFDEEQVKSRDIYFNSVFGKHPIAGTENDLYYLIEKANPIPDLYLACGTEDFLYENNLKFKAYLEKHKISYEYEESSGDHNWAFWDEYIQKVLKWMIK